MTKIYPGVENEFTKKATEMKFPLQMDKKYRDMGSRTKIRPEKVIVRDSKTGRVYGERTIMNKVTEDKSSCTFLQSLLTIMHENEDITSLPDSVIKEIKKNINAGSRDLEQKWKNALELVNKAYEVVGINIPTPDEKGAWFQYENLLSYAVKQLSSARGLDGDWRLTSAVIKEELGNRRFFVEIPNAGTTEVDGSNMDEIIDHITNKMRRHGAKVKIDERTKNYTILSVWKGDVRHEKITIKEIGS